METIIQSADSFVTDFSEQMKKLKPHHFISKQQSEFFRDAQFNLKQNEMIIICDFAENYSFVIQDAIQSFHWSNDQATVHPFCLYYKDADNIIQCKSIIVIGESLKHDINAVHLFQRKVLDFIRVNYTNVTDLLFFSDGAPSQYKNKKNMHNLCQFKTTFNFKVEWHFFATSHGKSACDALGGAFKREAAKASLQRPGDNFITNAKQLFDWAQSRKSKTSFIFCSNTEHEAEVRTSRNRYNNVRTITGTQSFHAFNPIDERRIETRKYSYARVKETFHLRN